MSSRTRAVNLTSSGVIAAGECWLDGFYVNSTSSGAFNLLNRATAGYTSTGGTLVGTITPSAGFHNTLGMHATAGLYCWGTAGTFNVTFLVREDSF